MFEPVHGSAPDIAGQGISNPVGTLSSGALMLRHLGLEADADRLEAAIAEVTGTGVKTRDIGGTATTDEVAGAVVAALHASLQPI
jgi:tartrate dehydrogenase/decarboxylase/D-malate dehydrogenase